MLPPQQKLQWAKHQRMEGNKLFATGEYKEAMDVYLTCLVAMDQSSKNKNGDAEEEEIQKSGKLVYKSKDHFEWLNLNTGYEALEKKIKRHLVKNLNLVL